MSHEHHHHHHQPPAHHHHEGDHHHQSFFEMEDLLQLDFELKKEKLLEFLKKAGLKEGQRVLEIGCGFAPLLELYCDTVGPSGSVTLTDPESRLSERLAPRLAARPNARFVAGSAEELVKEESGSYDVAVMVNVYHHLADPEAALAGLRRILSPGGRLIVIDFVHDTFRLFASKSATPAAAAAQARLAQLIRPEASPVTGLCATRLQAHGFELKLSDSYVMQDRFNGTRLGRLYTELICLPHSLGRLVQLGRISESERDEILTAFDTMREDPDAVLFSHIQVMLAADVA